jgi:hypothetical protein
MTMRAVLGAGADVPPGVWPPPLIADAPSHPDAAATARSSMAVVRGRMRAVLTVIA